MGFPAFTQQIISSFLVVMLNNSLYKYGGDFAISAHGVVHSLQTLLMMPIFGLSQGLQPIIGYNFGAKKYTRVKNIFFQGVLFASVIAISGYLVVLLLPNYLASLFTSDIKLLKLSAHALRIFLAFLPVLGFGIVGANYFQAVGKPRQSLFLNLSRQIFFFLPALYLLPQRYGLNGIWYVPPFADAMAAALTAIAIFREMKNLKDQQPGHNDGVVEP